MAAQARCPAHNWAFEPASYGSYSRPSNPLLCACWPAKLTPERESLTKEEAPAQTTKEGDSQGQFERPNNPQARRCCMRQYQIMQQTHADRNCAPVPCFDAACARDISEGKGCRYSEAFHKWCTNPCMWDLLNPQIFPMEKTMKSTNLSVC